MAPAGMGLEIAARCASGKRQTEHGKGFFHLGTVGTSTVLMGATPAPAG